MLGKASSNLVNVTSEVQGSVGPILFIVYINDLPKIVDNKAELYADDSKLIRTVINEEDKTALQKDIDRITEWSHESGLPLNLNQCHIMHLRINNSQFEYIIPDVSNNTRRII